jgi:hypothetical protein
MGQPTWRLIRKLMVPQREAGLWTPALDYVSAGKLYRILVETLAEPPQAAAANPAPDAQAANAAAENPSPNLQLESDTAAPPPAVVAKPAPAADVGLDQGNGGGGTGGPGAAQGPDAALPRDQQWTPDAGHPCTADGDPSFTRKAATLIIDTCATGALIAKVGGSTADIRPDKDKVTLFGVGRHCVFSITDANKTGSLYLGVNDAPESIRRLQGQLEVTISEAL